ncbi:MULTISPECIES: hypothetical protein [Eisenbergiella]|uniref:hypothetical protein n=1 Tax=Eisenbergiella TaxID=1432051 RepID=UPI0023F58EFB|nr:MULTISPECIES: hypothetical protein [Eisenbergiella]MCI6705831.1 hypothetical protein [Eisenbergiella massiliensis]MDY5524998.1 hypothetical protein [Eisenbergiella porci]
MAMAMICVFIDFTSFLIIAVASGNRKSRHSKTKSEVTALSIAGIPEMKKAPIHFIMSAVSNSYSIIQIWSNHISPFRYSKTPENLDFPGFLNHFDTVCTADYLLLN